MPCVLDWTTSRTRSCLTTIPAFQGSLVDEHEHDLGVPRVRLDHTSPSFLPEFFISLSLSLSAFSTHDSTTMDAKSSEQQQPFRGGVVLDGSKPDLTSTDIAGSNQESFTSHTTTQSTDPTLPRQPPIRINVRTEVQRIPLTWEEVSTVLSSDTSSKCWAGNEKETKYPDAVVSV